ncbi:MAG: hypothetical protein JSR15_12945, partial [Proteobacteria bacterium]|nr:hypothetical protein [Pseudomonadota bacterium]
MEPDQRDAWIAQIELLQSQLGSLSGEIFFEFAIPRMGSRIDAVILLDTVVCVCEFKVGASTFTRSARDQVWDYALDLKNFHEASHELTIVPILVATAAQRSPDIDIHLALDSVAEPVYVTAKDIRKAIDRAQSV